MARTVALMLIAVAMLFPAYGATADMYKWVDENGIVHFSDSPPASVQEVKTIQTPDYPSPSQDTAPAKSQVPNTPALGGKTWKEAAPQRSSPKRVEIFTTSWCGYCKQAIAFLRAHRIEFTQYDIEKDPAAAAMMAAFGGTGGVPFAIINGKVVRGFSSETYKKVLGIK